MENNLENDGGADGGQNRSDFQVTVRTYLKISLLECDVYSKIM